MRRVISIILILGAIALGYLGYQAYQDSQASLKIGNLELSAQDNKKEDRAMIYFGLGVVALIAGAVMLKKK